MVFNNLNVHPFWVVYKKNNGKNPITELTTINFVVDFFKGNIMKFGLNATELGRLLELSAIKYNELSAIEMQELQVLGLKRAKWLSRYDVYDENHNMKQRKEYSKSEDVVVNIENGTYERDFSNSFKQI